MPRNWSMCLMFTRRWGATTSSFISASRSVPPARMEPRSPSRIATCSLFVGLTYSNGRMGASVLQSFQYAGGSERQKWHSHPDGIGHCVRNGRTGRNHGRLGQSDDAALVVTFAGHHVDLHLANVGDARQPIELHVRVQHAPTNRIENLLLVERITDAHDERADRKS